MKNYLRNEWNDMMFDLNNALYEIKKHSPEIKDIYNKCALTKIVFYIIGGFIWWLSWPIRKTHDIFGKVKCCVCRGKRFLHIINLDMLEILFEGDLISKDDYVRIGVESIYKLRRLKKCNCR